MKKEGIMRINSYNKFFAKVAEIMNTTVKAAKQLDARYNVELANHVYLNVYRGCEGSLFIHDHRGISHITSCYDFKDFKSVKELYERLVSDYSESARKEQQYFDLLDEKRKLVCDINQILKDGIRNLYKCENHISFEVLERSVIRKCDELIRHNRLKAFWFTYIARQLDEVRRNTNYLYTPYITAHRNRW